MPIWDTEKWEIYISATCKAITALLTLLQLKIKIVCNTSHLVHRCQETLRGMWWGQRRRAKKERCSYMIQDLQIKICLSQNQPLLFKMEMHYAIAWKMLPPPPPSKSAANVLICYFRCQMLCLVQISYLENYFKNKWASEVGKWWKFDNKGWKVLRGLQTGSGFWQMTRTSSNSHKW